MSGNLVIDELRPDLNGGAGRFISLRITCDFIRTEHAIVLSVGRLNLYGICRNDQWFRIL